MMIPGAAAGVRGLISVKAMITSYGPERGTTVVANPP